MSDKEEALDVDEGETKKKPNALKPMILAGAGAAAMGIAAAGASFLLAPGAASCEASEASAHASGGHSAAPVDVTFVNLEPMIITLGPNAKSRYLKISLSLETTKKYEDSLYEQSPRMRDALNSYLRAVEEEDLIRPAGMARLRAQMLRRLQLAAPDDKIAGVLITDFVLN